MAYFDFLITRGEAPDHQKDYIYLLDKVWAPRGLESKPIQRLNDSLYKLKINIRTLIGKNIKVHGFKKNSHTEKILDCSFKDFKKYLENKFEPWMNWDNHGKYTGNYNETWNIDHIIPISSAKTREEIYKLNHFSNLQPLCSKKNQDKKDKLNYK